MHLKFVLPWTARSLLAGMGFTGVATVTGVADSAQLPTPCQPGTCAAPNAAFASNPSFVSSGAATAKQAGKTLTVTQTTNQAILNWSSFNISADGKVQFVQPSASSIALNRIFQQSPSSIFGQLTANGQIYLVNPNGFLFGATARVNTAGIIASSLQIPDANFNAGLLAPSILQSSSSNPNLAAALTATDVTGTPLYTAGTVTVQSGAQLSATGGRILLAAPTVQNAGTLSAPDGQVILAAGQQVFLQASSDASLRGLIVEVDQGGTAWNQLTGQLNADRGNISLIGLAVNQDGRISASTSVSANGSVRLEAADNVAFSQAQAGVVTIAATQGGQLELGSHSSIDLEPELSSTATAVIDEENTSDPHELLLPSTLSLVGEQVLFEGGSISAPNGQLNVVAAANPSLGVVTDGNAAARIRVDAGTSIDLSGSDAELPMSDNLLAIQLRANELADDPNQRYGALRGLTVYVDTRVGTSIVGASALQAAEATVPYGVAYWTTNGGSASFTSEGDVVVAAGTNINVSGGKTTYDAGVMQTTQLVGANGRLYDIGTANALLTYTGVVNPTFTETYNKWGVQSIVPTPGLSHYESGYVEGSSAGTIQFAAPAMVLDGRLTGQAVNGPYQRSGSAVASGGTLILGLPDGLPQNIQAGTTPDFLTPAIDFVAQPTPVAISDDSPLVSQPLQLPAGYLVNSGFQNTRIYGDTSVTLPAGLPLYLNPGSSLLIDATRVNILSNITAADGSVQLQSVSSSGPTEPDGTRAGIQIGNGVSLDVRGLWTNDSVLSGSGLGIGPTLQSGGTITLAQEIPGGELVLGNQVSLHASGGAWLSSANTLTGGTGGSISILDAPLDVGLQIGSGVEMDAFGVNGATGGSFSLSAPRLLLSSGAPGSGWSGTQSLDDLLDPGNVLNLNASLFANYGFSSVKLLATGAVVPGAYNDHILTVQAGTSIDAIEQTLLLNAGYETRPSASSIAGFDTVTTLPAWKRSAVDVSLSVVPQVLDSSLLQAGLLDVETGAAINTDPGGSIKLVGVGGVYVDGTLNAPGGSITLQIPTPLNDPGYLPDLSIDVGPHAALDASGAAVITPSQLGLALGQVLPGGSISLLAARGAVVAEAGSQISITGSSATLDIPTAIGSGTYLREDVASSGGSLTVQSPESISLLGGLHAAAGQGIYGNPAGGSLEVDLTQAQSWFLAPGTASVPLPSVPLVIQMVTNTVGHSPSASDSGTAQLGVSQIEAAGFDSLHLVAGNEIQFTSSTPLSLAEQAIFDAPSIATADGIQATVKANYVLLGDSQELAAPASDTVLPGTGSLDVQAQQIDLLGSLAIQGAQSVILSSAGDVTLRGVVIQGAQPLGSVTLTGDLTIDAARLYPATQTSFAITALGADSEVRIGQTDTASGTPLSAGGSLSISADRIESAGTIMAPFGSITLSAGTSLALDPGSLTSVSASGSTIPYGSTQLGGAQWIYTGAGSDPITISGIPQRTVQLLGPSVSIASGATIDLQGGGELQAYEWVPGTGGSTNALAAGVVPGLYAVLPSLSGHYAPYDPQESGASALTSGASIYLSGGGGLAAGTYPLLPASYGLLPGAYLVQVQTSGYSNIVPGQQESLANGTPVVAGYLTFGSTGLHTAGYEGVAVWAGGPTPVTGASPTNSYAQELAAYTISDASKFFAAAAIAADLPVPNLPADAGRLDIAVSNNLNFAGTLLTAASDSAGQSAEIDISANALEVTGTSASVPTGTVAIAASEISGWKAGDLILGGSLSDGSSIDVTASSVTIGTGAQVQAAQVILVAGQAIDLQQGSSVLSNSAATGGTGPSTMPLATPIALTGDLAAGAALLAVSDQELPIAMRPAGASTAATVSIESGAKVSSLGAIAIDAPGNVTLAGTLKGPGANWSLASSSIGLMGQASNPDTLEVGATTLAALQNAGAISLSALGAIDIYAPLELGNESGGKPTLTALTLSGQSLNYLPAAGSATFSAQTLTAGGATGAVGATAAAVAVPVAGAGTLAFDATEFDVGSGTLAISGVAQTQITASSSYVGQGTGGIVASGSLTITAPVITAGNAALSQVSVPNGTLSLNASPATATTQLPASDLGGELDFSASTISQSGTIIVPAGVVSLQAAQNVNLAPGAVINVSGVDVAIADQTPGAEGGRVTLTAAGNLNLAAGSKLSVSGAGDSPAGQIQLTAGGSADIASTLQGQPGSGAQSGLFSLEAGTLVQGLSALSSGLQAGGFNQQVNVLVHSGNLVLGAGSQLTANQVTLTSDSGLIDIAGTISAPNSDVRGEIGLYGNQGVTLESTGQLHADTVGGAGIGGEIELGTNTGGVVSLDSGSVISAAGTAAAGTLLVRAPLIDGNTDIAVTTAGSNLTKLGQILIEPVITEAATTAPGATSPTAADYTHVENDVASQMNSAAANIANRLDAGGGLPLQVRAAVDLVQDGDLTITTAPNFNDWRFNGQPVDLTVRASGNLTLATTLSDGFTSTSISIGNKRSTVQTLTPDYDSASFRLVAGADSSSPNPLGLVNGSDADLQLGSSTKAAIVRTGTGEIDLVASGDIAFSAAGGGPQSEVYTAGLPGAADIALTRSTSVFNFPTGGGNVVVNAGGEIIGAVVPNGPTGTNAGPSITTWQIRQGETGTAAQWGIDLTEYAQYGWNVASLGGGDVKVSAGGDIMNLSAAAADSSVANANGTSTAFLSGGLEVRANGDIGSGQFYAADGSSLLNAGGAFSAVRADSDGVAGSLIALDNAVVNVEARLGVDIDAVVNPTVMSQFATAQGLTGSYFTYTENSALLVQSTAGDVTLGDNATHIATLLGSAVANGVGGGSDQLYPATLSARALSGDLTLPAATLFPSDNGQLELIAGRDIDFPETSSLIMSDAFAASVASAQSPGGTSAIQLPEFEFQSGRHAGDTSPALVAAGRDINDLELTVPKATRIIAGRDITDLYFSGQNLNSTDLTLISAGRDFIDTLDGIGTGALVQIAGPGSVDVLAGRNVNLGFSDGIVTVGNLVNSNLTTTSGANLTIMAGLGQSPDYTAFLQNVVAPDAAYQAELVTYVEGLSAQTGLSFSSAESDFKHLSGDQQRDFLNGIFFHQLLISGEDDNTVPGAGFVLGYAAIDALFPNSRTAVASGASPYVGDLTLNFSQIYTDDGGNVALLVPGGAINVGLANAPASVPQKQASQLGIVAEGPGNVDIYAKYDVNVNSSRIFTLGGGNILIWSDEGNIDAGQGAKSSVSAPAPQVQVNAAGQVKLDFSGAVAGSGIRTIQVTPSVPPGNVDLIAPEGTVNAGDAGIGASGNINIAAEHVLGLDNIQFGGTATGVPAQVSDIGVSLAAASSVGSGATNSATSNSEEQAREAQAAAAPLSQAAISWLDVFVTGLGEENCRPDDMECLKRQKTN